MVDLVAAPGTALLLDAAGTLVRPAAPIADTYARIGRHHGVDVDAEFVAKRLAAAMQAAKPLRRADPDWRPYWAEVVLESTGSDAPSYLDALVSYFRTPAAWDLADGVAACCEAVRDRGMRVAVVSNWDLGLRPLLTSMGVLSWIDALVVSAEEGIEKPDPRIFQRACARLGVEPRRALHVGDSPSADVVGARAAGCAALLFPQEVENFHELRRILVPDGAPEPVLDH